jgi:hypothetical protein
LGTGRQCGQKQKETTSFFFLEDIKNPTLSLSWSRRGGLLGVFLHSDKLPVSAAVAVALHAENVSDKNTSILLHNFTNKNPISGAYAFWRFSPIFGKKWCF